MAIKEVVLMVIDAFIIASLAASFVCFSWVFITAYYSPDKTAIIDINNYREADIEFIILTCTNALLVWRGVYMVFQDSSARSRRRYPPSNTGSSFISSNNPPASSYKEDPKEWLVYDKEKKIFRSDKNVKEVPDKKL